MLFLTSFSVTAQTTIPGGSYVRLTSSANKQLRADPVEGLELTDNC
jgi:hypothetical protein